VPQPPPPPFNDFRIETIDAFFQTVLRNLARELDLTASLNISLNDEEVMEQAVDDLIEQLDEKSPVLSWIMDYIHEKMDDDKGWNIMGQIKNFGKNIFEDAYKEHSYDLQPLMSPESTFFPDYSKELRAIRQKAKENIKKYADHFFEEMDRNGFSALTSTEEKKASGAILPNLKGGNSPMSQN
jgi:ATP-dependent exoDNAse (exonuclease V) beta subunit